MAARWERRKLRLKKDHGWECRAGYKIFVADRGAVRFDIPQKWVIAPQEDGSIKFHDKQPPDDDCTLQMTVFYLNEEVDWSGLALGPVVDQITDKQVAKQAEEEDDEPKVEHLGRSPVVELKRARLEAAWTETRYIDADEKREARTRTLLARWSNIQPIITFAFWADDAPRMNAAWDELLRTLTLADYVEDPTRRLKR